MNNNNSLLSKLVKLILIIAIIFLIYYLVNRGKKNEFKLNETVKVGNVEVCFKEVKIKDKLYPENAPEDYQYFESQDSNKTILDISGTIKNTTDENVVLEKELPISIVIGRTKYTFEKLYENEYGTDFLEESKISDAVIFPGETLNIHCILVAKKTLFENNKTADVIIKNEPKDYSMNIKIDYQLY